MSEEMKEETQGIATEEIVDNTVEATVSSGSFLESVSEDVRGEACLQDFKDVEGLAKSYISSQKMLGNSIRIPGEDASEEVKQEFFKKLTDIPNVVTIPDVDDAEGRERFLNKLGRPETADAYELQIPEGFDTDPQTLTQFKQLAHEMGLSNIQASKLAEFEVGRAEIAQDLMEQDKIRAESTLKDKWGTDYPNRMSGAKAAAEVLAETFPDDVSALLNGPEGNNPALISMLSELGGMMKEQGHVGKVSNVDYGVSAEEAKEMIGEIRNNKDHAFYNAMDPGHSKAVEKMNKLYKTIYG